MVRGPLEEISPRDQKATAGSPSRTRSAVTTVSGRITVSGTACADTARRMNPNRKSQTPRSANDWPGIVTIPAVQDAMS